MQFTTLRCAHEGMDEAAALVPITTSGGTTTKRKIISGPSVFFLGLAASLAVLWVLMRQSSSAAFVTSSSIGTKALLFVTAAVGYDNLILSLGTFLAGDDDDDDSRPRNGNNNLLKWLSYPRFLLHFVGTPFLYTTTADIATAAGWLDGAVGSGSSTNNITRIIARLSTALAAIATLHFFNSPGITQADTTEFPPKAAARQLVWFTYAKPDFLFYVLPSIVVAFWNLWAGMRIRRLAPTAGNWLILSAVSVFVGSAQKKHVVRFTGNFVEVVMLWCMFLSATSV